MRERRGLLHVFSKNFIKPRNHAKGPGKETYSSAYAAHGLRGTGAACLWRLLLTGNVRRLHLPDGNYFAGQLQSLQYISAGRMSVYETSGLALIVQDVADDKTLAMPYKEVA